MGGQTHGVPSLHVLFLNWRDTRNPEGGGSEVYVERIAAELTALGHRATILCSAHAGRPAEERDAAGVWILRRGGRLTVYLRAAMLYLAGWLGFGRLSARGLGRPDVVVDVCNGLPFFSAWYRRGPVIALVHHVHREQWPVVLPQWLARVGWWIESRLAPWAYRRCAYVTVSEATRAELAGLGVAPARVTIIHNGTPEVTSPLVERGPSPSMVILGRLVPHKRVEVALHAVAALRERYPDVELVVAGQGWWEPRLRSLVDDLGIADRVRFAGYVSEVDKDHLLSRAWVALMPSLKEGWGLTIVEAGIRGTPTVAFREAGGVAEALVDGATGLLADDDDQFVALVGDLLADDQRRKLMGEAAITHAERFTWPGAGRAFADLVERVAGRRRR
jgi:glycosyltransferase involved in cell wall biosynthesis